MNIEEYLKIQKALGSSNIELTYKCPLQCPQCIRENLRDSNEIKRNYIKEKIAVSDDVTLNDFRKLCKFFDSCIALCGQFSDPVYHKDFFEILKICSYEFPYKTFKIHTAAHQKNLEWYRRAFDLTENNVTWIFGLDGLPDTSPLYRKNQNSQLIYDAMILGREMKKNINWQFIAFGFNEHQIDTARNICKETGILFKLVRTDRDYGGVELASKELRATGPIKEWSS